ncbi:MAG: hypothetical protein IIB85_03145, partial [Chloroflexi bacterium]|nr:hypothetical protein [Chloroflexota bacterium]
MSETTPEFEKLMAMDKYGLACLVVQWRHDGKEMPMGDFVPGADKPPTSTVLQDMLANPEQVLCVNCEQYRNGPPHLCLGPDMDMTERVTGRREHVRCVIARSSAGKCGPLGKHWKAKEQT